MDGWWRWFYFFCWYGCFLLDILCACFGGEEKDVKQKHPQFRRLRQTWVELIKTEYSTFLWIHPQLLFFWARIGHCNSDLMLIIFAGQKLLISQVVWERETQIWASKHLGESAPEWDGYWTMMGCLCIWYDYIYIYYHMRMNICLHYLLKKSISTRLGILDTPTNSDVISCTIPSSHIKTKKWRCLYNLSPIIMVQWKTAPNERKRTYWRYIHWTMIMGGRVSTTIISPANSSATRHSSLHSMRSLLEKKAAGSSTWGWLTEIGWDTLGSPKFINPPIFVTSASQFQRKVESANMPVMSNHEWKIRAVWAADWNWLGFG